jgi:hypothetical protein
MNKKIKYQAKGHVLGNMWGGGSGAYPTIKFQTDTKEELLKQANEALNDGSLDSGMGFESLIGAILDITAITTIDFEGKEFTNEEMESEFIGTLTDVQIEHLEMTAMHY